MPNSDADLPKFKAYKDGESIPPVDPEDIKRTWEYDRTHSLVGPDGWQWTRDRRAVCNPGVDVDDVSQRCRMIERLANYDDGKLLAPWKHAEAVDDVVFRIAATFPLQFVTHHRYQMPGDYLWEFDVNAFIQRLIDETGVAHTWKRVQIRLAEGDRMFSTIEEPGPSETAGEQRARQLLWTIWERCNRMDDMSRLGKDHPQVLAALFADYPIENLDLVRELVASF